MKLTHKERYLIMETLDKLVANKKSPVSDDKDEIEAAISLLNKLKKEWIAEWAAYRI